MNIMCLINKNKFSENIIKITKVLTFAYYAYIFIIETRLTFNKGGTKCQNMIKLVHKD